LATLVQQLYSQNHWDSIDGVQTIWNFTFSGGYIFPDHVKAYYTNSLDVRVDVIVTPEMLVGEFQLQVIPAIPASAKRFVIYRDTPKDLPLVDFENGAIVIERNLDRVAKQAVFVAAEVLDGADVGVPGLAGLGFKSMYHNPYTGASTITVLDNGKAHMKTDATAVTVPNTLPLEFLTTIINHSLTSMVVTFTAAVGILQGGNSTGKASWTLAARQTLSITKIASGFFYISGNAV
jgi:Phage T7 tail fibre protein